MDLSRATAEQGEQRLSLGEKRLTQQIGSDEVSAMIQFVKTVSQLIVGWLSMSLRLIQRFVRI